MEQGRFSFGAGILVAVFGIVFSWPYLNPLMDRTAPVRTEPQANVLNQVVSEEEIFAVPVPADWDGRVVGVLEGGRAYAIEQESGERFYAFFDMATGVLLDGTVRIHGQWLGMTCAYRNTVFAGECVPEVAIQDFEFLD